MPPRLVSQSHLWFFLRIWICSLIDSEHFEPQARKIMISCLVACLTMQILKSSRVLAAPILPFAAKPFGMRLMLETLSTLSLITIHALSTVKVGNWQLHSRKTRQTKFHCKNQLAMFFVAVNAWKLTQRFSLGMLFERIFKCSHFTINHRKGVVVFTYPISLLDKLIPVYESVDVCWFEVIPFASNSELFFSQNKSSPS
ncbi:hypothetical protein EGR_03942 [Echinococcus granulosus]|uniref:Uncharacterized protein n=1 Tax=Echinococcus granulosus TaxID=6210 RepID=W6USC6_ECHGR|nr:hypothetical protein EGR_03942 [Echinococcus granulosus]EUB61267.1 hypothetical protein EGR_03942 [Echinococcus granulosus]